QDPGRLESRQCRIAGDVDQPRSANSPRDVVALVRAPPIVGGQCRANDLPARTEKDAARLAGQPNTGHIAANRGRDSSQRLATRAPPLGGVLLIVVRRWAQPPVIGGRGGDDVACLIDGNGVRARDADIQSKQRSHSVVASLRKRGRPRGPGYPAELGGTAS